jgi:hypothetical protein
MTNTTIPKTRYECYSCRTDLTRHVAAAVFGRRVPLVEFTKPKWPERWRVVIDCPTDNLPNVFGAGDPDVPVVQKDATDMAPVVVQGRPPTPSDKFWTDALEKVNVEHSLERIDELSKHLFTIYTVVGGLLTATGIVTGTVFDAADLRWIALPLAPLAISLALAVAAITPRFGTINPANLETVRDYYTTMLKRRGRLIFLSGLLFALSLLLTIPAFWMISRESPSAPAVIAATPAVVLSKTETGFSLAVKVEVSGLPCGADLQVRAAMAGEELLRTRSMASESGTAVVDVTIPVASMDDNLVVRVLVRNGGKSLLEQQFIVTRQPQLVILKQDGDQDGAVTTPGKK